MTPNIKEILKQVIIDAYNAKIETAKRLNEYYNKKRIGQEFDDYLKPRVTKTIEFINPKTGRKNHKTLRNVCQTYIYTEEMYEKDLQKWMPESKNTRIYFQVNPDDSVRSYLFADPLNPTEEEIDNIIKDYGQYAEQLVNFKVEWYPYFGEKGPLQFDKVNPVFSSDEFFIRRDKYMEAKSAWCSKYGCD